MKKCLLFVLGGTGYVALELFWRGRSHVSMFLAGGLCFLLLGALTRYTKWAPTRVLMGAGIITGVELIVGLLVNRDYAVWDYRGMPGNFRGQICLGYSLLWMPVSLGATALYEWLNRKLRA